MNWRQLFLMSLLVVFVGAAGYGFSVAANGNRAGDETLSLKNVPDAVKTTILAEVLQTVVDLKLEGSQSADAAAIYDVEFEFNGTAIELEIASNGEVLEKEVMRNGVQVEAGGIVGDDDDDDGDEDDDDDDDDDDDQDDDEDDDEVDDDD